MDANSTVRTDPNEVIEALFETGWSDGFPIVPPIRRRVDDFVAASGRKADDLIASIPPMGGKATVEKLAANAVMAGCKPEYMPVIVAAVEALLDPSVNVGGMICSMHSAIPLLIINGPIRGELAINSGFNVFGQGHRANATIGRAINLILVNLGGAKPGEADRSTFGQPGNFAFCIAENEENSPFNPLHVDRGFARNESTVTVIGAEPPHINNNATAETPKNVLLTTVSMMKNLGSMNSYLQGESAICLSPEHAEIIARHGWKKTDIQQFLFEHARNPIRELKRGGPYGSDVAKYKTWPRWIDRSDDNALVPVARRASDFLILVAGGPGKQTAYLPTWATRSATRRIEV